MEEILEFLLLRVPVDVLDQILSGAPCEIRTECRYFEHKTHQIASIIYFNRSYVADVEPDSFQ